MLRTYLVCREKQERERETSKRHVGEAHSVPITAILLPQRLELLLRQNSVTAHAHQSKARRLASDHCAIENHRPKSAVRPISVSSEASKMQLVSAL
jgi:hypothetical protein